MKADVLSFERLSANVDLASVEPGGGGFTALAEDASERMVEMMGEAKEGSKVRTLHDLRLVKGYADERGTFSVDRARLKADIEALEADPGVRKRLAGLYDEAITELAPERFGTATREAAAKNYFERITDPDFLGRLAGRSPEKKADYLGKRLNELAMLDAGGDLVRRAAATLSEEMVTGDPREILAQADPAVMAASTDALLDDVGTAITGGRRGAGLGGSVLSLTETGRRGAAEFLGEFFESRSRLDAASIRKAWRDEPHVGMTRREIKQTDDWMRAFVIYEDEVLPGLDSAGDAGRRAARGSLSTIGGVLAGTSAALGIVNAANGKATGRDIAGIAGDAMSVLTSGESVAKALRSGREAARTGAQTGAEAGGEAATGLAKTATRFVSSLFTGFGVLSDVITFGTGVKGTVDTFDDEDSTVSERVPSVGTTVGSGLGMLGGLASAAAPVVAAAGPFGIALAGVGTLVATGFSVGSMIVDALKRDREMVALAAGGANPGVDYTGEGAGMNVEETPGPGGL